MKSYTDTLINLIFFTCFLVACISMYACYAPPDPTINTGNGTTQNTQNMGGITFFESSKEQYGFDGSSSGDSYISLAADGSSAIDILYTPPSTDKWDAVQARSSSASDFTVTNGNIPENTRSTLNIIGANGSTAHTEADLEVHGIVNDKTLPKDVELNKINVEIYQKLNIPVAYFFRVSDPQVPSSEPPTKPSISSINAGMNDILKMAVCSVELKGSSDWQADGFDINGNGLLDFNNMLFDNDNSPEATAIVNSISDYTDGPIMVYVKGIQSNWTIVSANKGESSITLKSVAEMSSGRKYYIGNGDEIYVTLIDKNQNILNLDQPLGKTYDAATSTVYEDLPGIAWNIKINNKIVDISFTTNWGGDMIKTTTHEYLHQSAFGNLHDVSEEDNIMHFAQPVGQYLRYRKQTVVEMGTDNPTGAFENQWNAIRKL